MIKGLGIDLVELNRFNEDNILKLANRILSVNEFNRFLSMKSFERKKEFLGGRFCAKEAFSKALSHSDLTINFKDIEVLSDEYNKPYIVFKKMDLSIHVSITHTKNYAEAIVIIEQ